MIFVIFLCSSCSFIIIHMVLKTSIGSENSLFYYTFVVLLVLRFGELTGASWDL